MSQRQPSMASQGQSTNSRTGKPPKDLIAERKARDQHLRSTTAELSTELRNEADERKAAQAREEADKRRGLTHSRQVKHAEQRKQMQSVLEEIEAETQKNRELRLAHASEVKRHQLMQEDLVQRIRERQEKARLIRAKLELQGLRVQSLLAEHSHGADVAAAEEKREHESRVRARAVERLLQQRAATAMAMSSAGNELEGVEERPQSTQLTVLNAPPSREDRNDDGQLILYQRAGAPALPSVGYDYRRPGTQAARRRLPSGTRPLYHSHQQRQLVVSSRNGSPPVGPGPNSNSSAEIGDPTEESLNLPSVLHPSHSEGRPSTMQGRGGAGGGRSPVSRGKPKRIPLAARPVGVPPLPRITPEEEDPRRNSPSRYGSRGGAATTSPSRGGARPPTRALTAIEQATKKAESEMIRRVVLLAKKQTERHQQGAKKTPNLVAINVVGGVASPPESEGAQAANYLMSSRFKSALVGATQKAREWIQTFGGGLERLSPDMSPNRSAARNRAERARARGGESDENLGERSALDDPDLEIRPLSERAATRAGRGEPGHQHSLPDPGYAEEDEFASPGRRHYDDGVDPNDPQFRDLAPSSSSSSVSSEEDDGVEEDNEESEPTPTQPGVPAQEAPPQLESNEADANDTAAAPTEQTPANESEAAPQPEADIQPTEELVRDSKVAEEKEVEGGERGADQTHASAEEQSATDAAVTDFVGQLLLGQVLAAVSEQQASEPQPQEGADAVPVENERQSEAEPEPSPEQPNEDERPETAVAAEDPTSPPQGEPDQVTESAAAQAATPVTAAEDSPDVPSENANVENEGQAPAAEEVVEPASEIPPAEVSEPVAAASEEVTAAESTPAPQEQVVAAPEVPVDPFAVYLKPKASTIVMVIRLQRHWRSFGRFVLMLKKKLDRPPIAIRPNQQHVAVVVVDHDKFPPRQQETHHLPAEVVEQEVQSAEGKPEVNPAAEEINDEKPADVDNGEQNPQVPSPESGPVEPTQDNATASPEQIENSSASTPSMPQEDCSQALGLLSKLLQVQRQAKARLEAGPIVVPSTSVLSKLLRVQSEKEWILLQHQFTQSNAFSQSSILSGSASPAKVSGGTGQQAPPTSPTLLGKSVEPTMALSTSAGGVAGADLLSSFHYRMVSSSFEWKKTLVAHRKSVTRKSVPRGSDAGLSPPPPASADGQGPTIQVIPTPTLPAGQESDRDHLGTSSASLNRSAGAGRLSVSVGEVGSPVSERSLLMHRNRRRQSWSQPEEAQQIPQQKAQSTEAMSGEDENAISILLQDDNVFSVFPRHIGHRDRMPARVLMLIIRLQRYWRRIGHYRARHRRGEFVRFQLHTGTTQTAAADESKPALQEPVQPSSAPEQAEEENYDEEDYADDEPQPESAAPEAQAASSPANQARKEEEEEDYDDDEYAENVDEAEEEVVEVRPPAAGKGSSRSRAPASRGSRNRPGTGDVDEDEDVDDGEVYSEDGEQETVDDSRQSTAAGRPGQARGQGRRGESQSRSRKPAGEEADEDYKDDEEYDDDDGAVDAEEEDFPAPPAGAQRDPDLEGSDDDYSDDDQADEAVEDSEGESKRPSKKDSDGDDVAPARGSGSKPGSTKVASQGKKRSSDIDEEEEAEDLDDYSDDNNEAEEEVAPKRTRQKNAPKANAKKGGKAAESDHDEEEAVDDYEDDTVE